MARHGAADRRRRVDRLFGSLQGSAAGFHGAHAVLKVAEAPQCVVVAFRLATPIGSVRLNGVSPNSSIWAKSVCRSSSSVLGSGSGAGGGSLSSTMLKAWRSSPTKVRHAVAKSRSAVIRVGTLMALNSPAPRLVLSSVLSMPSNSPTYDVVALSSESILTAKSRPSP